MSEKKRPPRPHATPPETVMRLIPKQKVQQIQFCENHLDPWTEHAAALGLNADEVAQLRTLTETARAKLKAKQEAQQAAKSATLEYDLARDAMTTMAAGLISQIRGRATLDGDNIYLLAQIPLSKKPSPLSAPGHPYEFTADLKSEGAILLRWKCDNPRGSTGTLYQVQRRTIPTHAGEPEGPWMFLALTGKKKYYDVDIPVGVAGVTYKIQSFRSTRAGSAALHTVRFGVPATHPARLRVAA